MKPFLYPISLLLLGALFLSGPVFAEPTHPNEVGLYMTPDGFGATGTHVVGTPVTVHLVLTKPADVDNDDLPFATIQTFDCRLNFHPIGNLFFLTSNYQAVALNLGDTSQIADGYLEYLVWFYDGLPVMDEAAVLVSIQFVSVTASVIEVTLGPIGAPTLPGQMSFSSVQGQHLVMHPVSGSPDAPVFLFNGEAVSVEQESFGSVKALYR